MGFNVNNGNQFDLAHLEIIKKGIDLFNQQFYWECHEELEHHWLEEPGPIRNVYWAVIQVAAAMIHYRESNLVGARGLIVKAKQKFERIEKLGVESLILEKYLSWSVFKKMVLIVPAEPVLSDFKNLFEFRFVSPDKWDEL